VLFFELVSQKYLHTIGFVFDENERVFGCSSVHVLNCSNLVGSVTFGLPSQTLILDKIYFCQEY